MDQPVFYRIDSSKVSLREYWWGTRNPLALGIAAVLKFLRVSISSASDDPNVESLEPFEVNAEALPPEVRRRMEMALTELEALGFRGAVVFHAIDDTLHNCRQYLASVAHESGGAVARVHNRIWAVRHPPKDVFFYEFLTELAEGRFAWSLSSKPDLLPPADWVVNRRVGATAETLWESHQKTIEAEARFAAMASGSREDLVALLGRHHAGVRDFHLRRGVFAPLRPADEEKQSLLAHRRQEGAEHADILAEIDRLQRKRTSWVTTLALLLVSLVIFVAAFSAMGVGGGGTMSRSMTWRFIWMIIPILFFHELGHYLAMRVFRYRNVRMFFIPFLGAAVMGQNYSAPGWKKVIVALMGPLPGIVLGGALGIAGIYMHRPLWVEIAVLTLILNTLQLLPVMPLDGGRVAHTLFFSRHWALDVGFRALAGVALLAGWYYVRDMVLLIIGALMLVSVPALYRLARIGGELRRQRVGTGTPPPADGLVPTDVAQTIIGRIKSGFGGRGLSNRMIAQHVLTIYETIATRPPGIGATLGFAAAHGAALVLAVALTVGLIAGQRVGMGFGFHPRGGILTRHEPKTPLEVEAIASRRAAGMPNEATAARGMTVVVNFASPVAADRAFYSVSSDLPPRWAVERFGQSLLIADGSATTDQAWVQRMAALSSDTDIDDEDHRVGLSIECTAPEEPTTDAIERELSDYLRVPGEAQLIPPWQVDDARSPAQRQNDAQSRRIYARAWEAREASSEDPSIAALNKKLWEAYRAKDERAVKALGTLIETARLHRERELIAALKNEPGVDGKWVDECLLELPDSATDEQYNAHYQSLGRRMGQFEMLGPKVSPGADHYARLNGSVSRRGRTIRLNWLTFVNLPEGAPAVVRWLDGKGCRDFKYRFQTRAKPVKN